MVLGITGSLRHAIITYTVYDLINLVSCLPSSGHNFFLSPGMLMYVVSWHYYNYVY